MSAINFWDGTQWVTLNTTGATGAQGPRGDKGDTGAPGAPGLDGKDGADGADGKDGSGVTIKGTANAYPPDAAPTVGDMWLVADPVPGGFPPGTNPGEGLVWDGTSWVNVGSIRGPKGEVGADGADGAPGADGQGFKVKGEFVAGPDYDNYDVVTYNGASYVQIATPSSTNDTPDLDPTAWQLLASGGADGAEGPRGPNCYVQVAEPVGGGVGELWIDPDAVAEGAAPALILDKADRQFITGPFNAADTRGGAGGGYTHIYMESAAGTNTLVVGGGNTLIGGNLSCNRDVRALGSFFIGKGGIAGDAVSFPSVSSVLDADYTLAFVGSGVITDAGYDPAGKKDRRVLFLSNTAHKVTVPTHASALFPAGWQVEIVNISSVGTPETAAEHRCEIVAPAGVTVWFGDSSGQYQVKDNRLSVRSYFGVVTLTKINDTTWVATGDVVPF